MYTQIGYQFFKSCYWDALLPIDVNSQVFWRVGLNDNHPQDHGGFISRLHFTRNLLYWEHWGNPVTRPFSPKSTMFGTPATFCSQHFSLHYFAARLSRLLLLRLKVFLFTPQLFLRVSLDFLRKRAGQMLLSYLALYHRTWRKRAILIAAFISCFLVHSTYCFSLRVPQSSSNY